MKMELVGCHGQTVYHQGLSEKYLGKAPRATWQMGEASGDCGAAADSGGERFSAGGSGGGGQGAPLVPMLDYCMFRSAKVSRVLLNLGGIGNLTAIPAEAGVDAVMAFDTGPGNMVIDACMQRLFEREFDRGGAVGRTRACADGCGGCGFEGGVLLCPATEVVRARAVWRGVCFAIYCDVPQGGWA